MRKCYQDSSSKKKYLFANNANQFFRYDVGNICKSN